MNPATCIVKRKTTLYLVCSTLLFLVLISVFFQTADARDKPDLPDIGDFQLEVLPGADQATDEIADYLRNKGALSELIDDLNNEINLLSDVDIVFGPWTASGLGQNIEPNAAYLPYQRKIFISYEFLGQIRAMFSYLDEAWYTNVLQTVLHEVGHALIHVNNIEKLDPNENEEVVADQLALLAMAEFEDEDSIPIATYMLYLKRAAAAQRNHVVAPVSEHPPDKERADNILCWLLGKIDRDQDIDSDCSRQFSELEQAWEDRLEPSLRDDPDERLAELVGEEGLALDDAVQSLMFEFDETVAYTAAVELCSPEPDPKCTDSSVLNAWTSFVAYIKSGDSVDETVSALTDQGFDQTLADAIGVYWCSPEPEQGCDNSLAAQAWQQFEHWLNEGSNPADAIADIAQSRPIIANLIGAHFCGESSCFAHVFTDMEFRRLKQLAQQSERQGRPIRPRAKFQITATKLKPSLRQKCKHWWILC